MPRRDVRGRTHCIRSSAGQTFGAWLPYARTKPLLDRELRDSRTHSNGDLPRSVTGAEALFAEIRKRGVARVTGQLNAANYGMSVPVFDRSGSIAAVLTAMGPTGSIDLTWTGPTAKSLRSTATELTHRIGGVPPATLVTAITRKP